MGSQMSNTPKVVIEANSREAMMEKVPSFPSHVTIKWEDGEVESFCYSLAAYDELVELAVDLMN